MVLPLLLLLLLLPLLLLLLLLLRPLPKLQLLSERPDEAVALA